MKLPDWLRIFLAATLGCLAGTALTWHYTQNWIATIVAFPMSFCISWIACAPKSFFGAFPKALEATAEFWREPGSRRWINYSTSILAINFGVWTTALLFYTLTSWLTVGHLVLPPQDRDGNIISLAMFVLTMVTIINVIVFIVQMGEIGQRFPYINPDEEREWVGEVKKYNSFTLPFLAIYGTVKLLIYVTPRIPSAMRATALFFSGLIRAWVELTASNLRLTSGCGGVLGLFLCLWQNWSPIPGCLAGGVAGLALWGSAKLALRYCQPEPQEVTA